MSRALGIKGQMQEKIKDLKYKGKMTGQEKGIRLSKVENIFYVLKIYYLHFKLFVRKK